MRWSVLVLLGGCPKTDPVSVPAPSVPPAPEPGAPVTDAAGLAAAAGAVTLVGRVVEEEGGTALELADGTLVWVAAQGVPASYALSLGEPAVRVRGGVVSRDGRWWLVDGQTPMPADVSLSW